MASSSTFFILSTIITIIAHSNVCANIEIIVNKGSFATIPNAATGEDSVNWLDNKTYEEDLLEFYQIDLVKLSAAY